MCSSDLTIRIHRARLSKVDIPLMALVGLVFMLGFLLVRWQQNALADRMAALTVPPPHYAVIARGIVVRRAGYLMLIEKCAGLLVPASVIFAQAFLCFLILSGSTWEFGPGVMLLAGFAMFPCLFVVGLSELLSWRTVRRAIGIPTGRDTAEIRLVLKYPASDIVRASICRPGRLLPTLKPAEPLEEVQIEEDEGRAVVVISNFNSLREQSLTALPGAWIRAWNRLSRRALLLETKRGKYLVMFSEGAESRWYGDVPLDEPLPSAA